MKIKIFSKFTLHRQIPSKFQQKISKDIRACLLLSQNGKGHKDMFTTDWKHLVEKENLS